MQRGAAEKRAQVTVAPRLGRNWDLEVENHPLLESLTDMEIFVQLPGDDHSRVFGSVKTSPPKISGYSLENGEVRGGLISFNLFIDGVVYTFTGKVDSDGLTVTDGKITPPPPPSAKQKLRDDDEEGSWSAQAQSGG